MVATRAFAKVSAGIHELSSCLCARFIKPPTQQCTFDRCSQHSSLPCAAWAAIKAGLCVRNSSMSNLFVQPHLLLLYLECVKSSTSEHSPDSRYVLLESDRLERHVESTLHCSTDGNCASAYAHVSHPPRADVNKCLCCHLDCNACTQADASHSCLPCALAHADVLPNDAMSSLPNNRLHVLHKGICQTHDVRVTL